MLTDCAVIAQADQSRSRSLVAAVPAPAALARAASHTAQAHGADPRRGPQRRAARGLWATVNICDTKQPPGHDRDPRSDAGLGFAATTVDERSRSTTGHRQASFVPDQHGDQAGRTRRPSQPSVQSGASFTFNPPVVLSGMSTFEWKRAGKVLGRATRHRPRLQARRRRRSARLQHRDLQDQLAGPRRANSRGSLVITPVTPSASSARSRGSSSTVHT